MKKIFLLSITSLAMLMADFTLIGEQLTPVSETTSPVTEPTPPPTITTPVSTAGIISNSVNQIWDDMTIDNVDTVSNMTSAWRQFVGPLINDPRTRTYDNVNIWTEVEAMGDGSSCSNDINTATNTRVEMGWIRGYIFRVSTGKWEKFTESKEHIGAAHGPYVAFPRTCNKTYVPMTIEGPPDLHKIEPSGFRSIYPSGLWRWHGWAPQKNLPNTSDIKAIYGECYMRLIVADPNLPDDRYKANFVMHISSDYRLDGKYAGAFGVSRYKKVTNDWVAINFLAGMTKAELEANPPPFSLEP